MRSRVFASLCVVFAAAAGCATAATNAHQLRGGALETFLRGCGITAVADSGLWPEHFLENGEWQSFGRRAPITGRYWFSDDQVCVAPSAGAPQCRSLYANNAGQVLIEPLPSAAAHPSELIPVKTERLGKRSSACRLP